MKTVKVVKSLEPEYIHRVILNEKIMDYHRVAVALCYLSGIGPTHILRYRKRPGMRWGDIESHGKRLVFRNRNGEIASTVLMEPEKPQEVDPIRWERVEALEWQAYKTLEDYAKQQEERGRYGGDKEIVGADIDPINQNLYAKTGFTLSFYSESRRSHYNGSMPTE